MTIFMSFRDTHHRAVVLAADAAVASVSNRSTQGSYSRLCSTLYRMAAKLELRAAEQARRLGDKQRLTAHAAELYLSSGRLTIAQRIAEQLICQGNLPTRYRANLELVLQQ